MRSTTVFVLVTACVALALGCGHAASTELDDFSTRAEVECGSTRGQEDADLARADAGLGGEGDDAVGAEDVGDLGEDDGRDADDTEGADEADGASSARDTGILSASPDAGRPASGAPTTARSGAVLGGSGSTPASARDAGGVCPPLPCPSAAAWDPQSCSCRLSGRKCLPLTCPTSAIWDAVHCICRRDLSGVRDGGMSVRRTDDL